MRLSFFGVEVLGSGWGGLWFRVLGVRAWDFLKLRVRALAFRVYGLGLKTSLDVTLGLRGLCPVVEGSGSSMHGLGSRLPNSCHSSL